MKRGTQVSGDSHLCAGKMLRCNSVGTPWRPQEVTTRQAHQTASGSLPPLSLVVLEVSYHQEQAQKSVAPIGRVGDEAA